VRRSGRAEHGWPPLGRGQRRQLADAICHGAAGGYKVRHESIVHVEGALVLGPVAQVVALREDSPDLRTQTERVGQNLEADVSLRGTIRLMAEGGKTQRLRRAVCEIEPAVEGVHLVLGVFEARQTRAHQTGELRSLPGEDATWASEAVKPGGHRRSR